jgi:predicted N-acetyltransferase YhbS
MTAISIRCAIEGDATSIAQLSGALGYKAETEAVRRRLSAILGSEADLMIVAVDSTEAMVGWLQAHAAHIVESGFRVEITGLIVAPEARRHGVGRLLVARAEQWARGICAEAIVVRSNVQRLESHIFYPALGYSATKTQKVYRKVLN